MPPAAQPAVRDNRPRATSKGRLHRLAAQTRLCLRRLPLGRARKIILTIMGTTILLIGIAMVVLPGPAIVVIPLGLAILATEYLWARRWLKRLRSFVQRRR